MFTLNELRQVLHLQLKLNGFKHPDNINIGIQLAQMNLEIHRITKLLQC